MIWSYVILVYNYYVNELSVFIIKIINLFRTDLRINFKFTSHNKYLILYKSYDFISKSNKNIKRFSSCQIKFETSKFKN